VTRLGEGVDEDSPPGVGVRLNARWQRYDAIERRWIREASSASVLLLHLPRGTRSNSSEFFDAAEAVLGFARSFS